MDGPLTPVQGSVPYPQTDAVNSSRDQGKRKKRRSHDQTPGENAEQIEEQDVLVRSEDGAEGQPEAKKVSKSDAETPAEPPAHIDVKA